MESTVHPLTGRTILLVEDNDDEIFMMQRAFKKAQIPNPLNVAKNGEQALEYLNGIGEYSDRELNPFPTIVFLDLNMPKVGGLEVLETIRSSSNLKKLSVFILSASNRPDDIERAATLGANGYFVKPAQIQIFQELVQDWFKLSRYQAYPQGDSEYEDSR